MPNVQFTGTIKSISPTEEVGANKFKKRSFLLVEIKDNYPNTWMLETHKDFTTKLDEFRPGQIVTCEVEITGREWNDKAFNTLKAFRITAQAGSTPVVKQEAVSYNVPDNDPDGLPF